MQNDRENILVILSSPSGVGKTTLTKKIQQKYKSFKISVSHTTRAPRSNEIDGVDYFFVSKEKFTQLIQEKKFYEHAKIFENYYGTLKKNVDDMKNENDIIFDIDWQGTKQLTNFKNLNLIKIYLITSKDELKKRLINRNQDNEKIVAKRLKQYESDVQHWFDYDYVVINNDLESCFSQIEKIIKTHSKEKMSFI